MAREPRTSASDIIAALESLSVSDLDAVIAAAQKAKEDKREAGKRQLVDEFRVRAEQLGLDLVEVLGTPQWRAASTGKQRQARKGAPRGPVPAKYRNPETRETWSGRGRAPL